MTGVFGDLDRALDRACARPPALSQYCAFTDTFGGNLAEQCWAAYDTVAIGALSAKSFRFGAILNISFGAAATGAGAGAGVVDLRQRIGRRPTTVTTTTRGGVQRVRARDAFVYPDGIWGAAFSAIGHTGQQLFEALRLAATPPLADLFSVCLATSGVGGALTLGAPSPYAQARWRYTSIVQRDFYRFYMVDMSVLGAPLGVNASDWNAVAAIVDTGTPIVNVPVLAYAALRTRLLNACSASKCCERVRVL